MLPAAFRSFVQQSPVGVMARAAVARFFDSDFEFVARAIAFIAIGLGFLVTNLVVFKRRARP